MTTTPKPDVLLIAGEFAERARVSVRTIRKWKAKGVGPKPIQPEGSRIVRYRQSEVEAWLAGRGHQ